MKWRKSNNWDDWCRQRVEEELEIDRIVTREERNRILRNMTVLAPRALDVHHSMLMDPKVPAASRVKLIELLYKYVIIDANKDDGSEDDKELPNVPNQGATEEEKRQWLSLVN